MDDDTEALREEVLNNILAMRQVNSAIATKRFAMFVMSRPRDEAVKQMQIYLSKSKRTEWAATTAEEFLEKCKVIAREPHVRIREDGRMYGCCFFHEDGTYHEIKTSEGMRKFFRQVGTI